MSHRDRLYQVYGERADLMEVHKEAGGITLTGFIAALAEQGPTRGPQNVFINRRIVKDQARSRTRSSTRYSQASIKERSPEVHLFIEMPPDALDVNVHPTKAEVRFRDQSLVHEVVRRALMDALGHSAAPQLQLRRSTWRRRRSRRRCRTSSRAGRIRTAGCRTIRRIPQSSQMPPVISGCGHPAISALSAASRLHPHSREL